MLRRGFAQDLEQHAGIVKADRDLLAGCAAPVGLALAVGCDHGDPAAGQQLVDE
jgi:hypothetical protein